MDRQEDVKGYAAATHPTDVGVEQTKRGKQLTDELGGGEITQTLEATFNTVARLETEVDRLMMRLRGIRGTAPENPSNLLEAVTPQSALGAALQDLHGRISSQVHAIGRAADEITL